MSQNCRNVPSVTDGMKTIFFFFRTLQTILYSLEKPDFFWQRCASENGHVRLRIKKCLRACLLAGAWGGSSARSSSNHQRLGRQSSRSDAAEHTEICPAAPVFVERGSTLCRTRLQLSLLRSLSRQLEGGFPTSDCCDDVEHGDVFFRF